MEQHGSCRDSLLLPSSPWLILGLITAYLIVDAMSYRVPTTIGAAFAALLACVVVTVAVIDVYKSLCILVVILVLSDDLSRLDTMDALKEPVSMLTVSIADISIINFVCVFIIFLTLLLAAIRWSRRPLVAKPSRTAFMLLVITAIYVLGSLHGVESIASNIRGALNDLSLPVLALGIAFTLRHAAPTRERIVGLWGLLLGSIAAKAIMWFFFFVAGVGSELGSTLRPANESGRILLVLLLAYGLVLQSSRLRAPLIRRHVGVMATGAAAFIVFTTGSRGTWIAAVVCCGIVWLLSPVREKAKIMIVVAALVAAIVGGLLMYRPETFQTLKYFAGTIRFWNDEGMSYSESNLVRIYELRNIHAQLVDNRDVLLGEGPGATFSDQYHPFPMPLRESDYTLDEIMRRRFQNPHTILATLTLSYGYGGMAMYLVSVVLIYARMAELQRYATNLFDRHFVLLLLAYFPTAVYYCWTPKTNVVFGIFLGTVWVFDVLARMEKSRLKPEVDGMPAEATSVMV